MVEKINKKQNKKGIILISTIFLMGVLIAIIAVNTEITKKNFDLYNYSKLIHQNNILISNVISALNSKASFVSDKTSFDILLSQNIDFDDEVSGIKMAIKFIPDNKTININKLIVETKQDSEIITKYNQDIYDIIAQLLYEANVVNADYFIEILADTMDKDLDQRASVSEMAYNNDRFENGFVASLEHLEKIKEYYIEQTEDTNINDVDFGKYFRFDDAKLDVNYMSPDLLSKITQMDIENIKVILDNNEDITSIDDTFGEEYNKTFSSLNITTKAYQAVCDLDIVVYDKQTKVIFRYDFEKKEASDIKIYY